MVNPKILNRNGEVYQCRKCKHIHAWEHDAEDCCKKEVLLEISKILINDLAYKVRKFRQDWIKNKICECVDKAIKGNDVYCKHMKNYLKGFFREEEKKIRELNDLMIINKMPKEWHHLLKREIG